MPGDVLQSPRNSMTTQDPRRHARARHALASVAIACAVATLAAGSRPFAQTFRAAVDLIAVDVQVLGRDARPVPALGPQDFEVTLDGRKRKVVSATFTRHDLTPLPLLPGSRSVDPPQDDVVVEDMSEGGGRTFIISIDTGSFRAVDAQQPIAAAQRFVRQLSPDDRVGVFTLPHGPNLSPTTSRVAVRQTLARVVGRKPMESGQVTMSVEQVIDITATAATQPMMTSRRTITQMFQEETASGDQITCAGTATACTEAALSEAQSLANALEEEVMEGLAGLGSILRLLQEFPGRKTVLLLSGGMPVTDRSGGRPSLANEVKRLGEQATYANATIHTIYFPPEATMLFSAESRRPRTSSARTRGIYTRALAEFSEPSGGMLIEVNSGGGETAVDRLLTQTSSYYVLGVEPEERDRDGRPHRLSVKVRQADMRSRSRHLVVVPRLR